MTSDGTDAGRLDEHGNRVWVVDVSRMAPLYQELYERIFAARLTFWGAGESGTVQRVDGQITYGGPDELMRALDPSAAVRRHLLAGDEAWVARLDRRWRAAAAALEAAAERLWTQLLGGTAAPEAVRSLLQHKVALNAIGMDSIMPPVDEADRWIDPHVDAGLLGDVRDGCYMPSGGRVAFDDLQRECWVLARDWPADEPVAEAARGRFVRRGLFYMYDALDNRRRSYLLEVVPRQTAARHRRAAPGRERLDARLSEIADRPWRRRYHRQWARRQLEGVRTSPAREQLLALHRFAGSARDYDEQKRRINMQLWRALFVLADSLGVSLTGSDGTAEGLCSALARQKERLVVDPIFMTSSRARRTGWVCPGAS